MTHANQWPVVELRIEKGVHENASSSQVHIIIYLLYLTLVYKIVENNSINKYQQNQVKI